MQADLDVFFDLENLNENKCYPNILSLLPFKMMADMLLHLGYNLLNKNWSRINEGIDKESITALVSTRSYQFPPLLRTLGTITWVQLKIMLATEAIFSQVSAENAYLKSTDV